MNDIQKSLLEKLEDNLQDIKMECYDDKRFSELINFNILDQDIEYLINKIQNNL